MDHKIKFVAVFFFWIVLLLSFVGFKEYVLQTGTSIVLKTTPVDPRDLFRGDYVQLRYDISQLHPSFFGKNATADKFISGDFIYVALEKQGDYYVAIDYSKEKFSGLYIKGKVEYSYPYSSKSVIGVNYGIESFFVPEGKGKEIEQKINLQNQDNPTAVGVEVSVDRFGNAVIKGLIIDGKKVVFEG